MQSSYRIIKSNNFNIVEEKEIPLKDHGYLSEATYSTTQANSLMQIAKQEKPAAKPAANSKYTYG